MMRTPNKTPQRPPAGANTPSTQWGALSTSRVSSKGTNSAPASPKRLASLVSDAGTLAEPASANSTDTIKVIVRVRPQNASEQQGESAEILSISGSSVQLSTSRPAAEPQANFAFDHVLGPASLQDDVFDTAGAPAVANCLAGYNASIFAYGQTGAGKTYTVTGNLAQEAGQPSTQRGLAPRVFERLFARIANEEASGRTRFSCSVSFLELYNEVVTDLLPVRTASQGGLGGQTVGLAVREDAQRGPYVENLSEHPVLNVDEVMQLMTKGVENRRVGETKMNRESSRSHSVFTCVIKSVYRGESGVLNQRSARLNLIDLAGSERNKASGAQGQRLREAASINKSLSTLGRVIMELGEVQAQGGARHVPYRDSKLTFLLRDSLGGNAKTLIVACVSASAMWEMETLSTLQFATRAKAIQNKAKVNEDVDGDVAALQKEVARLTRVLEMRESDPRKHDVETLQQQLEQLEQERLSLRNRLDVSAADTRSMVTDKVLLEQQVGELQSERESLREQLRRAVKAAEDGQAGAAAARADRAAAEARVSALEQKARDITALVDQGNMTLQRQLAEGEVLRRAADEARARTSRLEDDCLQLRMEATTLRQDAQRLHETRAAAEQSASCSEAEAKSLRRALAAARDEARAAQQSLDVSTSNLQSVEKQLAEASERERTLRADLAIVFKRLDSSSDQLNRARSTIADMNRSWASVNALAANYDKMSGYYGVGSGGRGAGTPESLISPQLAAARARAAQFGVVSTSSPGVGKEQVSPQPSRVFGDATNNKRESVDLRVSVNSLSGRDASLSPGKGQPQVQQARVDWLTVNPP